MKLFQIEEPEGAPLAADGPGAVVGIAIGDGFGAVAVALGGNAEILPDADGEFRLAAPGLWARGGYDALALENLFLGLRGRAEKQLHQPVTHAVIAAAPLDDTARPVIAAAAAAAGVIVLKLLDSEAAAALAVSAPAADRAVLGAAIAAEDLAPPPG